MHIREAGDRLDLMLEFEYWWNRRLAGEWFGHGFLGGRRSRLIDLLVVCVAGCLGDLLLARSVALQILDLVVAVIAAAATSGDSRPAEAPWRRWTAGRHRAASKSATLRATTAVAASAARMVQRPVSALPETCGNQADEETHLPANHLIPPIMCHS